MPSIFPDRPQKARAVALVGLLLAPASLSLAPAAVAADKPGQLCEVTSVVTGEGQLRDRSKKCKKGDVLIVPLATASIAATRVAALVCDLSDQVLVEGTTETPGVARVTCTYTGEFRSKR
jgi:hypothetical protein